MTVTVSVPPAVLTLTAPAPTAAHELRVIVPPARLRLRGLAPHVSGSGPMYGPEPGGEAPIRLWIGGHEVGGHDWQMTGEEILGSVGRGTLGIQDRANSTWEPAPHMDVLVTIRSSGWVLFRGEVVTASLDLPPGMTFRWWQLQCRDYNGQVGERLVGAPDGYNFWRPNDREQYRPVDPDAIITGTDQLTVRSLLSHYFLPGGNSVDTSSKVYLYSSDLGDPDKEQILYDSMSKLSSVIAQIAQLLPVNVQDWLDPDLVWHHVAVPSSVELLDSGDPGDLDAAPSEIGPGGVGAMALSLTYDGQAMPQQVYAQAATTFVLDGFATGIGGSGWFPEDPDFPNQPQGQDPTKRQAYVSIPGSWSRAQSILVTQSALARAAQPTMRGSVRVQGVDGWRVGQAVTINDARLPPSAQGEHLFVIQRVAWSLYPTHDVREYTLEFGDGPVSRAYSGGQMPPELPAKKPVITYEVRWYDFLGYPDANPIAAGERRYAIAVVYNPLDEEHQPTQVPVHFGVIAIDANPSSPTYGSIIPGEGSFSPADTVTDQDGKARSVFTAGSIEGLSYSPFAETELPEA